MYRPLLEGGKLALKEGDRDNTQRSIVKRSLDTQEKAFLEALAGFSGTDALNRILDHKKGQLIVRNMANTDLFWLIKKIGEEDALPILKMATDDQWQYLLDMVLWRKDHFDLNQATLWLDRLQQADPDRLAAWLYSEGQWIVYDYLLREVQVIVWDKEDGLEPPKGVFTVDDLLYVRILEEDHRVVIEGLLQHLARVDYDRYYALLTSLSGILAAEHEQEMLRRRNVRLAEEGFLPFDEALSAYAHLSMEALAGGSDQSELDTLEATAYASTVPVSPLIQVPEESLFLQATQEIEESGLKDRIRLEFAGLCNQLASATGEPPESVETLVNICRIAAGYVNIALEKVSGGDRKKALETLRKNPIQSVFRAGFGSALELSWKARRWMLQSWFSRSGLELSFWGESWGGCLAGLLEKRPKFFRDDGSETPYKDFETRSEINASQKILERITVVDRFLEKLNRLYPLNAEDRKAPIFEFHNLMFNLWARHELKLAPGFDSLSIEEVRDFFQHIRGNKGKPPYTMPGFREKYMENLLAYARDWADEERHTLAEILGLLWDKFTEEYAWVAKADLEGRYMRFVLTRASLETFISK
jgi:hypothetical protein